MCSPACTCTCLRVSVIAYATRHSTSSALCSFDWGFPSCFAFLSVCSTAYSCPPKIYATVSQKPRALKPSQQRPSVLNGIQKRKRERMVPPQRWRSSETVRRLADSSLRADGELFCAALSSHAGSECTTTSDERQRNLSSPIRRVVFPSLPSGCVRRSHLTSLPGLRVLS